jgi:hypothetical protein
VSSDRFLVKSLLVREIVLVLAGSLNADLLQVGYNMSTPPVTCPFYRCFMVPLWGSAAAVRAGRFRRGLSRQGSVSSGCGNRWPPARGVRPRGWDPLGRWPGRVPVLYNDPVPEKYFFPKNPTAGRAMQRGPSHRRAVGASNAKAEHLDVAVAGFGPA